LFLINHTLISETTPQDFYEGNYIQIIKLRNIRIKSTYNGLSNLGKGAARIHNYSIFYSNGTFTGKAGKLNYDGYSWYSDISASDLPEGEYYINAFFKDKYNDSGITYISNNFTVDHIIDCSNFKVIYSGYMDQIFNLSFIPKSTFTPKDIIDNTEEIYAKYKVIDLNTSLSIKSGNLTWTGNLWNKIIDVSKLLERDYIVLINFSDSYDSVICNSSVLSPYHYIEIFAPIFEYNFASMQINILNFAANCSYHGVINNLTTIPTNISFKIINDKTTQIIASNFDYISSYWQKSNINLNSIPFSNITIYIYFEVNESFGSARFSLLLNNGTENIFISKNDISIIIKILNSPKLMEILLIENLVPIDRFNLINSTGNIYQIDINDNSIIFNANISIKYSQNEIDLKGLDEWLLTIYACDNGV